MVENNATKSRNQAFLEQHERRRLSKPCNRMIDLRGKVPGECQSYQFGGQTHYLDDRAYLLAKQLLAHFNGQYTIGVHETLLKKLAKLAFANNKKHRVPKPILSRDRSKVQAIPFTNDVHRDEPRIIFATALEVQVGKITYSATTIDITSRSIGLSLKRTFALKKGAMVSIKFLEWVEQTEFNALTDVPYQILLIEHDPLRTKLILTRQRNDNHEVTQQLELWCHNHNSSQYLDLNNELFLLACQYYLHLYCRTLTSPKLWLSTDDAETPLRAFQLSNTAQATLQPLYREDHTFPQLPIKEILTKASDLLLWVSSQQVLTVNLRSTAQIKNIMQRVLDDPSSHLLLLKTQHIAIDTALFENEISRIAEQEAEYSTDLIKRLNDISLLTSITDITTCCQFLPFPKTTRKNLQQAKLWQGELPNPSSFAHAINREEKRFAIRTTVDIVIEDQTLQIKTDNLSATGLAIILPGEFSLLPGNSISVSFTTWQQQVTDLELVDLIYNVRNCRYWAGNTYLGLKRSHASSPDEINQFFNSQIKQNEAKIVADNQHLITSQESKIFGALLGQYLATVPFYFAMDNDHKRIIQAAGSTNNNYPDTFWSSLQSLVTMMSELVKAIPQNSSESVCFGLYCLQNSAEEWEFASEYDFNSVNQKSFFITRALAAEHYHFFHCRLCPVKASTWLEQETELNHQLSNLRGHSPHKFKQIKDILYSLFAVGELTDITDILKVCYD